MQFLVPQFIETEDKVVGPFSIRQFIYVAIAGGFCFMLYFTVTAWLFAVLSALLLGTALSFAFIKINGVALTRVAMAAFNFYWKPQTYVWQPDHPEVGKKPEELARAAATSPQGIALEDIVSGLALRSVWQNLQTGATTAPRVSGQQFYGKMQEKYEVFRRMSGDRNAARRIDYK